jgi:hypothetical protein
MHYTQYPFLQLSHIKSCHYSVIFCKAVLFFLYGQKISHDVGRHLAILEWYGQQNLMSCQPNILNFFLICWDVDSQHVILGVVSQHHMMLTFPTKHIVGA